MKAEPHAFVRRLRLTAICFGLLGSAGVLAGPDLEVPVRFHVQHDLPMTKDGLEMRPWVSESQIRGVVIPEVNRIWQRAGIRFVLAGVMRGRTLSVPDRRQRLDEIVRAKRDEDGESDPERIRTLSGLIDFGDARAAGIDVYLVPYLGEASQGNTKRSLRRIFVAEWSDKATKGRGAPERFSLTESGPFEKGSLSRTVAHELGHALGLRHPDKASQSVFGLLMGGRKPGYDLTPPEIEIARGRAASLVMGNS